jgi:Tol biopolymer transport system component
LQLRSFVFLQDEIPLAGRVSPNGKQLSVSLLSERDGVTTTEVVIIDAENHRTIIAINAEVVAWSPDSTRILLRRGEKYKWDHLFIDAGNRATEILPLPKTDAVMDWSPDGSTLSVMAGRPERIFEQRRGHFYPKRQLYLYNLETRAAHEPFTDPEDDCINGIFSHDGSTLAYSRRTYSTGKPVEFCEITHISSGKSSTLINFTEIGVRPNGSPFWSKDGTQLVWQVARETADDHRLCELWFIFTNGSPHRAVVEKEFDLDFFRVIDWR